jgi:ADP-ribosylglycohydrolase
MVEAHNSVPTAIYCYLAEQDPARVIKKAISLEGDRDTIACMAAAIAGAYKGAESFPKTS